ncbi:MAG: hypothetical protein Q9200_003038 [Gallowayella weberi]
MDPAFTAQQLIVQRKSSHAPTFTEIQRRTVDPFALSKRSYLAITLEYRELGVKLIPLADDLPSSWAFARLPADPQAPVDIKKLHHWITSCEHWHFDTCEAAIITTFPMRLIDVQEGRLAQISGRCRYIALSYLWGQCKTFRTLKESVVSLEEARGLFRQWHLIPLTIRDAILLTRQLGERYLWVDAICIVQDDWENKSEAIANMDSVYSNALVTIIAGSGIDANAGLPGLHRGTRNLRVQAERILPDLRLMAIGKGVEFLKHSVYSTRAWTYQEAMLSRRTLVFVNGEIYFRCRKTCWYEEVDMCDFQKNFRALPCFGSPSEMRDHSSLLGKDYPGLSTTLLATAASTLSARQLTVPSDILHSFRGISNVFSKAINTTMFWGLPTAYFDFFLLWDRAESSLRRREGFPSWSWAGWQGRVVWDSIESSGFLLNGRLGDGLFLPETWIQWYRGEQGYVRPLYLPSERPDSAAAERVKQPGKVHGMLRQIINSSLSPDYLGVKGSQEPSVASLHLGNEKQREQLLYFWTTCASFRLRRERDVTDAHNTHRAAGLLAQNPHTSGITVPRCADNKIRREYNRILVMDKHNQDCGVISVTSSTNWSDERFSDHPLHEIIVLSGRTFGAAPYHVEKVDLASQTSILKAMPPPPTRNPDTLGQRPGAGGFKDVRNELHNTFSTFLPLYRIMLIEWKGGIAYRAGIGAIYKTALDDAVVPKQWKEIVLG